ncbi:MAG TPA: hypothetical protein V6C97_28750 [Oculatellaceae cyanobacterium]
MKRNNLAIIGLIVTLGCILCGIGYGKWCQDMLRKYPPKGVDAQGHQTI